MRTEGSQEWFALWLENMVGLGSFINNIIELELNVNDISLDIVSIRYVT